MNGHPFEFETADALGYHNEASWMLDVIRSGDWNLFSEYYETRNSDMGYPVYLILIYSIFGKSILIARILKALLGAFTVYLIYKIAQRNFNEKVARIAAILAMCYPNLIYYAGLHVKETEMVFLLVAFTERADFLLRQRKLRFHIIILMLLLGISLYFYRAVLAYSAFVSLFLALVFSRREIFQLKRSLLVLLGLFIVILFLYGSDYFAEALGYWSDRYNNQEISLIHRAQTNKLARFGSAIIFAPFALIAPFPTFVNIETQQNHMLLSGAFFVKNVLAYFVMVSIIAFYKNKNWKDHVLILAIMLTYISILTMSKFALVERFHLPALPFHIIFASYGISKVSRKTMNYFPYYLIGIAIIIIGWNWIKLAGRGLI
jgi:4-amino-4-deoxy-L-arabinose transferase-like glycosyltransferase